MGLCRVEKGHTYTLDEFRKAQFQQLEEVNFIQHCDTQNGGGLGASVPQTKTEGEIRLLCQIDRLNGTDWQP